MQSRQRAMQITRRRIASFFSMPKAITIVSVSSALTFMWESLLGVTRKTSD